jgi:hypothetical protein
MSKSVGVLTQKPEINVGDGVTVCGWSDRHAYTVVARTAKTLTLQRDRATLIPDFKPEFDGFHCVNNIDQDYVYERDPNGGTERAYWSDTKDGFYVRGEPVITGRHEFYDYNF